MKPLTLFIGQGHHMGSDVIRLSQRHKAIEPKAGGFLLWVPKHPRLHNLGRSNPTYALPRILVHDGVLDTLSGNRCV